MCNINLHTHIFIVKIATESAIQTFKHYFLAGLSTAGPEYPVAEWDHLLPQVMIMLNLLHNLRINPKLSAYDYLFGDFECNKTPLAPPGTKVVIHKKVDGITMVRKKLGTLDLPWNTTYSL